jgi:hypothetical protein
MQDKKSKTGMPLTPATAAQVQVASSAGKQVSDEVAKRAAQIIAMNSKAGSSNPVNVELTTALVAGGMKASKARAWIATHETKAGEQNKVLVALLSGEIHAVAVAVVRLFGKGMEEIQGNLVAVRKAFNL